MERGKFINLEGIDGAGKTTQLSMAKPKIDVPCHFTREATDGPIGKLLRYTYLAGVRKCDERVINMLYAADRFDHITNEEDGLLKYLNQGIHVLSDRYYLSSMAYNTYMMPTEDEVKEMIEHTITMNRYTMETLRPDLTIYIDLDPEIALQRMHDGRDEASVYETSEKLNKIYRAYQLSMDILRERFNDNIVIVDGNRSAEEIHVDIMSLIHNEFNKK